MLAYVFWHRPGADADPGGYEHDAVAFHRSLARTPPAGLRGSWAFRVPDLPWLGGAGYEDWYLLADFTALGVLNEAAVGRGHRTAHDRVAHRYAAGAGALYALIEGSACAGGDPGEPSPATWVSRPAGERERPLGELLGDGLDPERGSLWRRALVLGPAPEYCVITCDGESGSRPAPEPASGVAETRLPPGWSAQTLPREVIYEG